MPVSDGWEVLSLECDDKEKSKLDLTSDDGHYQDNSADSPAKWSGHTDSASKRTDSLPDVKGHYLSRKIRKIFDTDVGTHLGGKVTPKDNLSVSSPERSAFAQKTDGVAMKTLFLSKSDKPTKSADVDSNQNMSDYQNPAYSFTDEHDQESGSRRRRTYEAPIYSVNSAGKMVPIIVEESENGEDTCDFFRGASKESRNQDSELHITPRPFTQQICWSGTFGEDSPETASEKARMLWRHTYRPDSSVIFYWLCVVTTAFLFNLWTIPLRATYVAEIQSSWQDIWFAFDAVCDFVYIVDIYITFRTCYIKSGVFVSEITHLNRHHRRDWRLALDILSVLPTDLLFLHSVNPYFRLNRLLKVHRVATFYRLGELCTWSPNMWRTLNLVHLFAVIIHYNACFYYGLSALNGFATALTGWAYPDPNLFPEYASLYRRYTYSFHWCMIGLGIVGDRYVPEADWQFVFSIYLHLLGLLFTVIFIGFVTVLMLGQMMPKFEFEKTMKESCAYMKQRKIPKDLRKRIQRFYQYSWANQQFQNLDEKHVLRFLPLSVRQEIELHSNLAALKQMSCLSQCDSHILRELVMCLRRTIYLPGQFVYRSGDIGTEMYIIRKGILQVIRDTDPAIYSLREGDVFGDTDLLASSIRRRNADVVSYGYSEVYVLTAEDVKQTLEKYRDFLTSHQHEKRQSSTMNRRKAVRAFGRKYHSVSRGSATATNQSYSKTSASKVHFTMSNADTRDESPDSGVPSTPSLGHMVQSETPTASNQQEGEMKNYLSERISGGYDAQLESLKASLDSVYGQESVYLQERLEDTEHERDMQSREIAHLRQQMAHGRHSQNESGNNRATPTRSTVVKYQTQETDKASSSKIGLPRNVGLRDTKGCPV